ncbi:MAG: endonuclease domain-containing protein [Actinomycetota bacterium]|nr:endonuclease domain-containing protein [Actinomycetota bacterium]
MTAGRLLRLHRGVYAVGHQRLSVRGRWMAATLACGRGALLSHGAATALWGLRASGGGLIDVTSTARHQAAGIRCHRARVLHPDDCAQIDAIPTTSLARTLLDQAARLHLQRLRTMLEAAQHQEIIDVAAIQALLARSNGHRGTAALKRAVAALADQAPWTQSELERRFLELIRAAGLPEPQLNVVVDGYVVDCFWPQANLIVELDGYGFHRSRRSFEEDRARDTVHTLAGRRTLRVTPRRVTAQEAGALLNDLRVLLARAAA